MSKTHSDNHSHHGIWHRFSRPLVGIYHSTVTPFYEWLGVTLFTRATAGTVGRRARIARLLGNMISLTAVITVIAMVGLSSFWTGGAALPLWAIFVMGVGVLVNTGGIIVNAAASHIKISQYYDAVTEQSADNKDLGSKIDRSKDKRYLLKATRTLHDINAWAGTIISWTLALSEVLMWASIGTFVIAPQLASLLFVISRVSAIVSAIGVWGTNQYRLHSYKQTLRSQYDDAYGIKNEANGTRHQMIAGIIDQAFKELSIDTHEIMSEHIRYRCYKALDSSIDKNDIPLQNAIVDCLKKELESFVVGNKFSHEKLMSIQPNDTDHIEPVSALDSMPVLEVKLFDALSKQIAPGKIQAANKELESTGRTTVEGLNHTQNILLFSHVRKGLYQGRMLNQAIPESVDVNTIMEQHPVEGTAHGKVFLDNYHTGKLAQSLFKVGS